MKKLKTLVFIGCTLFFAPFIQANIDEAFIALLRAQRRIRAHQVKVAVAEFDERGSVADQPTNGDEKRYTDLRGSFGKTLQHQASGFVNVAAFNSLVFALQTANPGDFNAIMLGLGRRLVNPQASLAFSLECSDCWRPAMPAAPAFASAEVAAEMVELYWSALLRDVPFNEYTTNPVAALAITDLNTMGDFRGPKQNGLVTAQALLRGNTPGDLIGPYVSQFLYIPIPNGPIATSFIIQTQNVPTPGITNDFNTTFNDWFTVINGGATGNTITFDATKRFIRNARDLGDLVHQDYPGQAFFNACLILLSFGPSALDANNPYTNNATQEGFVTYGVGDFLSLVMYAVEEALKTAWYQKWQVHRRLRPEEFGFYVQTQIVGGTALSIHPDLINSNALVQIFGTFSSYFLPQMYPEGSPAHPSYPAGHATLAGAAATILKALFNEDFVIPSPVQPNATNDALVAYAGTPLTIGNELNKLAANISLGRDHAGVHYRSDGIEGILLGEKIAIHLLNNESFLRNINFNGYTLTKFDGAKIMVGQKQNV